MKPRIGKKSRLGARLPRSEAAPPPAAAADEADFDAAVARKLAELTPPAGLREAILARARVLSSRLRALRQRPPAGGDGANAATS